MITKQYIYYTLKQFFILFKILKVVCWSQIKCFLDKKNVWLGINSKSLGNFSHCTEYCKYLMDKENTTRFFLFKIDHVCVKI